MHFVYFCIGIILNYCLEVRCLSPWPWRSTSGTGNTKDRNEIDLSQRVFGTIASHILNRFVEIVEVNQTDTTSSTSTTTQDPEVVRATLCNDLGGKIINKTLCYEYVKREQSYYNAVTYCSDRGGHLWVPNVYDPKLSFILFEEFPEVHVDPFGGYLWIGIELDDSDFVSVTGENFDKHPLLQSFLNYDDYYYYFDERCIILALSENKFELTPDECTLELYFACEYAV